MRPASGLSLAEDFVAVQVACEANAQRNVRRVPSLDPSPSREQAGLLYCPAFLHLDADSVSRVGMTWHCFAQEPWL